MRNRIVMIAMGAMLVCSCDGLLPKKIADDTVEEEIIKTDESLPPEEIDYKECIMLVHEFYTEKYLGDGSLSPNRFLSRKLRKALEGIGALEYKTGYIILDCDPFINAQDVVGGLREGNFTVEPNGFFNSLTFSYDNVHVNLFLTEENGNYYIDDVELPSGKRLTELYEEERLNNE